MMNETPAETIRTALQSIDPGKDLDDYIAVLRRLPEVSNATQRDNLIAEFFYNRHNQWLREGKYASCKKLLEAYVAIVPAMGHPKAMLPGAVTGAIFSLQEAIAKDAVALAAFTRDDTLWPMVESLLPQKITYVVLAFNLACYCSLTRKKEKMLEYIRLALDLGRNPATFMSESDFDGYKSDPDFLKLTKTSNESAKLQNNCITATAASPCIADGNLAAKYWIWANERASEAEAISHGFPVILQQFDISLDEGKRLNRPIPAIEFIIACEGNGRLTDNLIVAPRAGLVFSARLQAELLSLGVDNIEYHDCIIHVRQTGAVLKDYRLANLIGCLPGIDFEKSDLEMHPDDSKRIEFINSLVLKDKMPSNLLMFRLEEFQQIIVVHEIIKNRLEEKGITGVKFYRPEDFSL